MEYMEKIIRRPYLQCSAVIAILFMLTSTAYMAWTYRIMELTSAPVSDAVTLVVAYLFQAVGIGLFSLFLGRSEDLVRKSVYVVLWLHAISLLFSVLSPLLIENIVSGCVQNLLCGWIVGYYLYLLAMASDKTHTAMTVGIGYSAAIIALWLLSLMGKMLYSSLNLLILCFLLTLAAAFVIRVSSLSNADSPENTDLTAGLQLPQDITMTQILIMAGILILLFSTVKSSGFGFPSEDVADGIKVELFRLFYAAGLLAAGFISDESRRHGAVSAVIALIIPFFILSIREDSVTGMLLWSLSYLTFGFFSIYRIVLFTDLSKDKALLPLCGFGMLIGRIGDAAGEILFLALSEHHLFLVGIAALLFMVSLVIFFRIYPVLYFPMPKRQKSEQEIFDHFSDAYNLSAREREVLQFLLIRKTNQEIAEELCISDGTVKYHIHNLLRKTQCPNRMKLLSFYASERDF